MKTIAVITGASSGLGLKFLQAVIDKYPQMDEYWIIARRKDRLEALSERYKEKKIVAIAADLSDETSYRAIAERLERDKPQVKVLINNAGYAKSGRFAQMEWADILNVISVNVKGMTMIQKVFLPYMKKGSYAVITCSASSFAPAPNQAVYSASKKYAYYLGKALREESLENGINVLLLCPGNMDTEMNPRGQGGQRRKIGALPFLDMDALTVKALAKAEQGKAVYTPGAFYKAYRAVGKMLPSSCIMKIAKKFY